MKRSSQPRATAELSGSLHERLNMYALAAGAAGVSLLALVPTAEGKIVYTPANVKLHGPFPLDLNHDGTVDFLILLSGSVGNSDFIEALSVCHNVFLGSRGSYQCSSKTSNLNAVRVVKSPGREAVAALRAGAKVQNGDRFRDSVPIGMGRVSYQTDTSTQPPHWSGAWVNKGKGVKDRYLGVKFQIKGRFHFGWARISVTTQTKSFAATLTGYAYETIPDKGIIAGKTKGPDWITVQPVSLGHLAAGASAIPAWRLKRTAATTH